MPAPPPPPRPAFPLTAPQSQRLSYLTGAHHVHAYPSQHLAANPCEPDDGAGSPELLYPLAPGLCPLPSQAGFKRAYAADRDVLTPGSSPQPAKRRKSTSKEAWTMSEDDTLLLRLKDDEGLPWKVIATRFRESNRGEFRVPTLQMRYKRLKEKMRVWDPEDVCAAARVCGGRS